MTATEPTEIAKQIEYLARALKLNPAMIGPMPMPTLSVRLLREFSTLLGDGSA